MIYNVGIDDTGTETQKLDGWAFFALPASQTAGFEAAADLIRQGAKPKLKAFHAKTEKAAHTAAYEAFLREVRSRLEGGAACWVSLNDPHWHNSLKTFAENVIGGGCSQAGLTDPAFQRVAFSFVTPLVVLARLSEALGPGALMSVAFDEDAIKRKLAATASQTRGVTMQLVSVLKLFYRVYRQKMFPNAADVTGITARTGFGFVTGAGR